mgnify:CR=1 FL=1
MTNDKSTWEEAARLHKQFMHRVKNMTDLEKCRLLEEAGIINERGELTYLFGGTANPSKKYEDIL